MHGESKDRCNTVCIYTYPKDPEILEVIVDNIPILQEDNKIKI